MGEILPGGLQPWAGLEGKDRGCRRELPSGEVWKAGTSVIPGMTGGAGGLMDQEGQSPCPRESFRGNVMRT